MASESPQQQVCIGYGEHEDTCGRPIGGEDLALNPAGLWCVRCERLRRETISEQMAAITRRFEEAQDGE